MSDSAVTRELADFVAGSHWRDIPPAVRREGVRGLLNYVGCALGGCADEAIGLAIRVLAPSFGAGRAGLIGRGERCDVLNAAFLNAAGANVLEYDDTHLPTVMHPAAPVAPGLFALAEARGASGAELLHAFILGVEVSCRVGNAVMPHHYRRGAHITATCGIFGAAAAAGKLIGLDPVRMNWALGHAATQSAGLVESLGSMSKSIGVGNAARNGLAGGALRRGRVHRRRERDRGKIRLRRGRQRHGRSRQDQRWARRALGNPRQCLQALPVRRGAVSGDRRVPRTAPRCPRGPV